MTANDTLRQLLDKRGVEWRRTPHYSSESMDNETVFFGIGIEWLANDHFNGRLGLRALKYEVTPEQAIAATLGRGTCRIDYHFGEWYCTGCGVMVGTCDPSSELCIDGNAIELWSYCPNCGRRVVNEQ